MQVIRDSKPMSRGVTQLMYVGDDEAVEKATGGSELGLLIVAAFLALQSRGIIRLAATGAAAWIGYRVYRRGY